MKSRDALDCGWRKRIGDGRGMRVWGQPWLNGFIVHKWVQLYVLYLNQTHQVLANQPMYDSPMHEANIYGPCDGLYYLSGWDSRAIWNPTINEVRTLPPPITKPDLPPNREYFSYDCCYGFGLDLLSGDYKVVVIKDYQSLNQIAKHHSSVWVYSLSKHSWKYCGDLDRKYYLQNSSCYILVKGCCFWLGSFYLDDENCSDIIITFDMTSDFSQKIPVPDYKQLGETDYRLSLGMYEDSLAFFSVNEMVESLGIWTLNDGIWTKIFNIRPIPNVWYLVGQWKSNKVLLVCKGKLVLYDLTTREIKDLEYAIPSCEGVFAYMESLVSVKDKIKLREDRKIMRG